MSCSSLSARPLALLISWRTVTKTSAPLRPCLASTLLMVDRRTTSSPIFNGRSKCSRPPAHMRRGSGTGGKKPPRFGWPSVPISLWGACGRKYNQCASGGRGDPGSVCASSMRSRVADRPARGAAVMMSRRSSLRPIQSRRWFSETGGVMLFMAVPSASCVDMNAACTLAPARAIRQLQRRSLLESVDTLRAAEAMAERAAAQLPR